MKFQRNPKTLVSRTTALGFRVCQRKEKGIQRGLNTLSVEAAVEVAFPV